MGAVGCTAAVCVCDGVEMKTQTWLVNANSIKTPLRARSVHMIANSPPYWALRDYQTGRWVGGDPECQHTVGNQVANSKAPGAIVSGVRPGVNGRVCKRCGAVREDAQIGLEPLHDCLAWARGEEPCGGCFVCSLRVVGREAWRVLRDDGTWWLNLGDSYASQGGERQYGSHDGQTGRGDAPGKRIMASGLKPKDLAGIPWRVALALQADGWYLRNDIIWHKPNPLPESVSDRCTKAHEYIFLLTKSPRYYFDNHAIREPLAAGTFERTLRGVGDGHKWTDGAPGSTNASLSQARPNRKHTNGSMGGGSHLQGHSGDYKANGEPFAHPDGRNKRTIWTVPTQSHPGSHFATWPEALVEPMIKAGTSEYGVCPTCGAPWQRVVDKGEAMQRWDNPNPVRPYDADSGFKNGTGGSTLHMTRPSSTAGWEPGCDCGGELEPVPAVVLDLFAGSGTTGVVSRRLGRNFIGLDLSFEYLQNEARGRLALDALAAWESGAGMQARPNGKAKKQTAGQLALLVE